MRAVKTHLLEAAPGEHEAFAYSQAWYRTRRSLRVADRITIPSGPGSGLQLDRAMLAHFKVA